MSVAQPHGSVPPVYQCINPIFRVTLSGQAAPGCPEAQLSCVAWEWGDGTVDVQAFPANHDFASAGKYTVTVKAYDSLGQTSSIQVPLKVLAPRQSPSWHANGRPIGSPRLPRSQLPVEPCLAEHPTTVLDDTLGAANRREMICLTPNVTETSTSR